MPPIVLFLVFFALLLLALPISMSMAITAALPGF